jgi:ankyrin repeat protein
LLLDREAEIEIKNNDGWTALHFLSSNGHLEVTKLLLEKSADIEAKNNDGWNALHFSLWDVFVEFICFLRARSALRRTVFGPPSSAAQLPGRPGRPDSTSSIFGEDPHTKPMPRSRR